MNEQSQFISPLTMQDDGEVSRTSANLDILFDGRLPNEVDITHDGQRVAFTVWEHMPGKLRRHWRIWVTDPDGKEAYPFIGGKYDEVNPRWSPDGQYLAFVTKPEEESKKPQLHLIEAKGGTSKTLGKLPNGVCDLAWAPDGKSIAFISLEGDEPETDPKVLAPARHRRLWIIRIGHSIPEPVTPANITVWEYTWSPDSKQFALYYASGSHSNDTDINDWYHSHIGTVPARGGAVHKVVPLDWQARGLAWSPDSTQIAYISGLWSDPNRGSGDIFSVSLENGKIRNLTPGIACSPTWCSWYPDNHHLLFTAVKEVTHQVSLLNIDDGTIRVLEKDFVMQGDQPQLAVTPDHLHVATIHSSSQQPHDIWSGKFVFVNNEPDSIEWKRLSRLSPSLEETLELEKTERINYASADGWQIAGLFTPPLHCAPNQLPPLYVEVHGGPSGAYCDSWFPLTHYFTANGFAVFRPNMRGSWGQGAAFADAVLGDMGGKDLQDILSGIEYLVQQGKIDGNRVCIGGWSNGGYLSACAITQSNRFRAAMVGAGIIDWHNMHAQSNIPSSDKILMAADPLEQPDIYNQRSPLTFANKVTTPTLILHGDIDPVVPVAQAYAFYRALYEHHVPVECVIYPREGHGLIEHKHMRDAAERQLRWFEQYTR